MIKTERVRPLKLEYTDADIEVGVATTSDEIIQAHKLCYEVYEKEGYVKESHVKLRLSLYHALPTTTTFIAKIDGKVIGTLMAIADGPLGIPADNFCDLSHLKQRYNRLVEGSGYAIHPEYRNTHGLVYFMLYKYFMIFAENYLKADCVVAAINPKQHQFYSKVLLFKEYRTEVVAAQSANGAPAVVLKLPLRTYRDKYLVTYSGLEPERNLFHYLFVHEHKNFYFPEKKLFLAGLPTVTPDIFKKIFNEEWSIMDLLKSEELQALRDIFAYHEFDALFSKEDKKYLPRRTPRLLSNAYLTAINSTQLHQKVMVKNISTKGLLVKFKEQPLILNAGPQLLNIEVLDCTYKIEAQPVWQRGNHLGFRIENPPIHWIRLVEKGEQILRGQLMVGEKRQKAS